MSLPQVLIIGRPNVGKSTLFNYWVGHRFAIESPIAGTTRDFIEQQIRIGGRNINLIDTAGLDHATDDQLLQIALGKTTDLIRESNLIIFLVSAKDGLNPLDERIAKNLRKAKKPTILVAAQADNPKRQETALIEFWKLGLNEPFPISVKQNIGIKNLEQKILSLIEPEPLVPANSEEIPSDLVIEQIPEESEESDDSNEQSDPTNEEIEQVPSNRDGLTGKPIRFALIGRPNVGKSTLFNQLLGQDRSIVSDIPGTTRDLIEIPFEKDGQKYIIVDTAGMRRPGKRKSSLEFFSVDRTVKAIDHADIVGVVLDPHEGITKLDLNLAEKVIDFGKAIFFVVNKWDLVDTEERIFLQENLQASLKPFAEAPVIPISALTGSHASRVLDTVRDIYSRLNFHIKTSYLNRFFGTEHDILYISQKSINPPLFEVALRGSQIPHFSFCRRVENQLRKEFNLSGIPVKWIWKPKEKWSEASKKLRKT